MIFSKFKKMILRNLEVQGWRIERVPKRSKVLAVVDMLRPQVAKRPLIRVGSAGDGGYLVPDDLSGIEALFSPGVGYVSGFEADCAQRGMAVHMADASVDDVAGEIDGDWSFEKKFLGAKDEGIHITLDDWVRRRCPGSSDLLLQMDIEGAEFKVIQSMSSELMQRFRYIVIEFHGLHNLWEPHSGLQYAAFEKLNRTHRSVHIHPNNCCPVKVKHGIDMPALLEVTYARKDLVLPGRRVSGLPHELDALNVASKPEVFLLDLWVTGR